MFVGVDPGKSGAIAIVFNSGELHEWRKLSETPHDLVCWLSQYSFDFALLERVHSSPQMGVKSAFSFGQSYGFCEGLLVARGIPFERVTPAKWQQAMKCRSKGDKNVTKRRAQELYPGVKMTHANADAILLAHYCKLLHG